MDRLKGLLLLPFSRKVVVGIMTSLVTGLLFVLNKKLGLGLDNAELISFAGVAAATGASVILGIAHEDAAWKSVSPPFTPAEIETENKRLELERQRMEALSHIVSGAKSATENANKPAGGAPSTLFRSPAGPAAVLAMFVLPLFGGCKLAAHRGDQKTVANVEATIQNRTRDFSYFDQALADTPDPGDREEKRKNLAALNESELDRLRECLLYEKSKLAEEEGQ